MQDVGGGEGKRGEKERCGCVNKENLPQSNLISQQLDFDTLMISSYQIFFGFDQFLSYCGDLFGESRGFDQMRFGFGFRVASAFDGRVELG